MTGSQNFQFVIGLETELPAEVMDNRPSITLTAPGNPGLAAGPGRPIAHDWIEPSVQAACHLH
ncbi:MAG: hypothetical protein ACR2NR_03305 [Solirubrobacteraceae bacterium]